MVDTWPRPRSQLLFCIFCLGIYNYVNSFTTLFVYLPLWNVFTNLFVYLTLCYCIYHVVCVFTSTVATLFLFLLLCLCIYYFGRNSLDLTVTLYSGRPRLTMQWSPAVGQGRLKCISTDFVFCIFRNLCFVQVLWILNFHKPAWHIFLVEMQHLRCRWFRLKSEEMVGGFYKLVGGRRLLLGDRLLLLGGRWLLLGDRCLLLGGLWFARITAPAYHRQRCVVTAIPSWWLS